MLLNQLGEIDVRYPKLFSAIWDSIQNWLNIGITLYIIE